MWITEEMEEDINENITWNPRATSWLLTLEDISDALAVIGYKVDVRKMGEL